MVLATYQKKLRTDEMQIATYFHKVYLADRDLGLRQFLGTAFPITPNGGLLTCRHVVDVNMNDDESVVIVDAEMNQAIPVEEIKYASRPDFDVAFIPDAFRRPKRHFFPVLSPQRILMGEDVYSVGFFVSDGNVVAGYFKGNIVNLEQFKESPGLAGMSLSYAVIEGLSGSPVLTYHNGPKILGLCHGSVQSRIAPREILEYQDERLELRETVTRIVELGQAYHASSLIQFLEEVGAQGYVVSSERVPGIFEE